MRRSRAGLLVLVLAVLGGCAQWFPDEQPGQDDPEHALVSYQINEMTKDPRQVTHFCGAPLEMLAAQQKADCQDRFWSMAWARIEERYPLADFGRVELHCKGFPDDCGNLRMIEVRLRDSDRERRAQAQHAVDVERRREIALALSEFGRKIQGTSCTSTAIGDTVRTHCY